MVNYAMTVNNKVIEILYNQLTIPKWPNTLDGPVIPIECDDFVEVEMIYNSDLNCFEYDENLNILNNHQNTSEIKNSDILSQENFNLEQELTSIKSLISQNYTNIKQDAIDNFVIELIKNGIL